MTSYFPPKPSPLVPGYRLDRYELLCPIAEGGMAAVWLARQIGKHGFQKLVAVKTILPQFVSEPDFRELFLDEARLASRIDHTNVAQILDLGEEHDVLYLVIEWVDGDSLHKLARVVAKKALPLPQAILLRVLSDACLGLHAAHELRDHAGNHLAVVHRDVSPQNILVSAYGTSKVIDFGIAKARDRLTAETSMGVVKGKLDYMSPEQALGLTVDLRADIWAIGAVFYRIVTGRSPYEASSPMSTMELLRTGQLVNPLSAMPGVHPAVCKVIEKALAPRAAGRFATAAELHDALEDAMAKAGACATATEVQAFLATHLGERMSARKQTIQLALEAAAHREKLAAIFKPATPESNSTIAAIGEADGPTVPVTHTSITRREGPPARVGSNGTGTPAEPNQTDRGVANVDEYAKTRLVNDAAASGSFVAPPAPQGSPIAGLDDADGARGPPTHTSITRRERMSPAVGSTEQAVTNRGARVRTSVVDGGKFAHPAAWLEGRRPMWLAFVLVLGTGSILGTLAVVRVGNGATASSTAPKVTDSVGASSLASPTIPPAILPPSAQSAAAPLAVRTSDPPSVSPPISSSTESTRKGAGALPEVAHSPPSPRAGTTPHPPKDDDGI